MSDGFTLIAFLMYLTLGGILAGLTYKSLADGNTLGAILSAMGLVLIVMGINEVFKRNVKQ